MKKLMDPEAITKTIAFARSEAKRLGVSINAVLKCWAVGFDAAAVIEFGRSKQGLAAQK